MTSWRCPASASWTCESTRGAAAWSSCQAIIAQASTTLDAVMIPSNLGLALVGQILEEVCTPKHAAHGAPVGIAPDKPLYDQTFALHVDRNLGAGFKIEPLPHRLGDRDLPFRRDSGFDHLYLPQ